MKRRALTSEEEVGRVGDVMGISCRAGERSLGAGWRRAEECEGKWAFEPAGEADSARPPKLRSVGLSHHHYHGPGKPAQAAANRTRGIFPTSQGQLAFGPLLTLNQYCLVNTVNSARLLLRAMPLASDCTRRHT